MLLKLRLWFHFKILRKGILAYAYKYEDDPLPLISNYTSACWENDREPLSREQKYNFIKEYLK
jgi:hypothetical protein